MELAVLFFIFEIREIFVNRNTDFGKFVMYYVDLWAQSPFVFFINNINFIYLSCCIFMMNIYTFPIVSLYILYFCDIVFKIVLAHKIQNNALSEEFKQILQSDLKVEIWQRLLLAVGMSLIFFLGVS